MVQDSLGFISLQTMFTKFKNLSKSLLWYIFKINNNLYHNNILNYIIKNKKNFKQLKLSSLLENNLNSFLKNNLDLKMYRFKSMLRLVYTGNDLKDRPTRDFFENKKNTNIMKFKDYLFKKKIYLSSSGLIFLSFAHNKKDLNYTINHLKINLKKFF